MDNQIKEKIKSALQRFPKELKYEVTSEEAFDAFLQIVKKHGIEKEKTDRFSDAVYSVVYGVEPLDTLIAQITKALDGNTQKAQLIAEDVTRELITENLKNYLVSQKTGIVSGIERTSEQKILQGTANMIEIGTVSDRKNDEFVMANGELMNRTQVLDEVENPIKTPPAFERALNAGSASNIIDDKLNKVVKLPSQEEHIENKTFNSPQNKYSTDPYREPIE